MIAVKEHDYLQAATATGSTRMGALVRHVLPNVAAPIIVVFQHQHRRGDHQRGQLELPRIRSAG